MNRFIAVLIFASLAFSGRAQESSLFRAQTIDENVPGAYQVALVDINGDGRLDLAVLGEGKDGTVCWYENPSWKKYPLAPPEIEWPIDMDFTDLDGDDAVEMALASGFNLGDTTKGGEVHWLHRGVSLDEPWHAHRIDAEPTAHRLRWADPGHDGRVGLIVLPMLGKGAQRPGFDQAAANFLYYTPPQDITAPWDRQGIDSSLHVAHGLWIDRRHGDSLFTASLEGVREYQRAEGEWQFQSHCEGQSEEKGRPGCSEITGGTGTDARPFWVTIEPWHGDTLCLYQEVGGRWQRTILDEGFVEGHAVACADFDQDGEDEILAGFRGAGHRIYYYDYTKSPQPHWERTELSSTIAVQGFSVGDIDQDGRLDFAAAGGATKNVVVFLNQQIRTSLPKKTE
ncbi:MAG: VCBS repeat-containing protein [bacterium]|jgi:hypothetical protein|nr:VCBS repeat-containing protein [bacterium]